MILGVDKFLIPLVSLNLHRFEHKESYVDLLERTIYFLANFYLSRLDYLNTDLFFQERRVPMAFIFQAKPAIYDLAARLSVGREVGWLASRYRDKMRRGDIVYYWSAGDEKRRGIYGWGEITSDNAFVDSKGSYRVAVTCRKVFPNLINVADVRANPILRDVQILRSAMGTNFLLTEEESNALRSLVEDKFGKPWAPLEWR
jgi:hypothetical protein